MVENASYSDLNGGLFKKFAQGKVLKLFIDSYLSLQKKMHSRSTHVFFQNE